MKAFFFSFLLFSHTAMAAATYGSHDLYYAEEGRQIPLLAMVSGETEEMIASRMLAICNRLGFASALNKKLTNILDSGDAYDVILKDTVAISNSDKVFSEITCQ